MRRPVVWCVLALVATSCSGSNHANDSTTKASPCRLIATLDDTAAAVAHANVADPEAFQHTLATAVAKYVTTVQQLRDVVPDNVKPDLDRLEAAVHQYRFEDAVSMRASLDAYASEKCATTGE